MFILIMIVMNVKLKILKILWMTLLHVCGECFLVYELRVVEHFSFVHASHSEKRKLTVLVTFSNNCALDAVK